MIYYLINVNMDPKKRATFTHNPPINQQLYTCFPQPLPAAQYTNQHHILGPDLQPAFSSPIELSAAVRHLSVEQKTTQK